MGGFDLASVIITGCPSLKRLMYDATSNPGDSNVPFRVMSIMQNSDQIEELVLDALSLKESFLPIARMGLQNHAESLRVTRLGNCPTTNRVATLPFFLPNVLASKNSTFFPPRSILDLVLISRTLSPLVPGRVPRSAASCLVLQFRSCQVIPLIWLRQLKSPSTKDRLQFISRTLRLISSDFWRDTISRLGL